MTMQFTRTSVGDRVEAAEFQVPSNDFNIVLLQVTSKLTGCHPQTTGPVTTRRPVAPARLCYMCCRFHTITVMQGELDYVARRPNRPQLDIEAGDLTSHLLRRFPSQVGNQIRRRAAWKPYFP